MSSPPPPPSSSPSTFVSDRALALASLAIACLSALGSFGFNIFLIVVFFAGQQETKTEDTTRLTTQFDEFRNLVADNFDQLNRKVDDLDDLKRLPVTVHELSKDIDRLEDNLDRQERDLRDTQSSLARLNGRNDLGYTIEPTDAPKQTTSNPLYGDRTPFPYSSEIFGG